MAAKEPDAVPYLDGLAFSRINYANALRLLGRDDEKQAVLRDAIHDLNNDIPVAIQIGSIQLDSEQIVPDKQVVHLFHENWH